MKGTLPSYEHFLTFKTFHILGLAFDETKLALGSVVLLPQGTRGRAGHTLYLFCTLVA